MSATESTSAHFTLTLATINRVGLVFDYTFAFELRDHKGRTSTRGFGLIPSGRQTSPNAALLGLALALRDVPKGSSISIRVTNSSLLEFGTLIAFCKGVDAMALIGVPPESLPAWQAAALALEPFDATFEYLAQSTTLASSLIDEAKMRLATERKSFIIETVSLANAT